MTSAYLQTHMKPPFHLHTEHYHTSDHRQIVGSSSAASERRARSATEKHWDTAACIQESSQSTAGFSTDRYTIVPRLSGGGLAQKEYSLKLQLYGYQFPLSTNCGYQVVVSLLFLRCVSDQDHTVSCDHMFRSTCRWDCSWNFGRPGWPEIVADQNKR